MTKYQEDQDARDRVVQAAMDMVDNWDKWPIDPEDMSLRSRALHEAIHALRSLHADQPPPKEES